MIPELILDEKHNIWSIRDGLPVRHGFIKLMEDKVHHINSKVSVFILALGTQMCMVQELDKGSTDGIIVATTRRDEVTHDSYQLIIDGKETGDSPNFPILTIEILKLGLVSAS
jgi:hypothetical protein